jgi:hypothetical protein
MNHAILITLMETTIELISGAKSAARLSGHSLSHNDAAFLSNRQEPFDASPQP